MYKPSTLRTCILFLLTLVMLLLIGRPGKQDDATIIAQAPLIVAPPPPAEEPPPTADETKAECNARGKSEFDYCIEHIDDPSGQDGLDCAYFYALNDITCACKCPVGESNAYMCSSSCNITRAQCEMGADYAFKKCRAAKKMNSVCVNNRAQMLTQCRDGYNLCMNPPPPPLEVCI